MLGFSVQKIKHDYDLEIPYLSQNESKFLSKFLSVAKDLDNIEHRLKEYAYNEGISLSSDQVSKLSKVVEILLCDFSIFQKALKDDSVEEIAVVGIGKPAYVYVKKSGWLKTSVSVDDQSFFIELVNRLARQSGKRITYSMPYLNANVYDVGRLHASIPPISAHELTVRKFHSVPYSLSEFVGTGILDPESAALLWLLVLCDCSIVITGNTASGKTSLLNALAQLFTKDERVLVIEETRELNLKHEHTVYLSEFGDIKLINLIWDSLRMRPDRLVIGEIRTRDEAIAMVESVLAGQARSFYCSMHANSCSEALKRFESFGIVSDAIGVMDCIINVKRFRELDKGNLVERRELREIMFPKSGAVLQQRDHVDNSCDGKDFVSTAYDCFDQNTKYKLAKFGINNSDKLFNYVEKLIKLLQGNLGFDKFQDNINLFYGELE